MPPPRLCEAPNNLTAKIVGFLRPFKERCQMSVVILPEWIIMSKSHAPQSCFSKGRVGIQTCKRWILKKTRGALLISSVCIIVLVIFALVVEAFGERGTWVANIFMTGNQLVACLESSQERHFSTIMTSWVRHAPSATGGDWGLV